MQLWKEQPNKDKHTAGLEIGRLILPCVKSILVSQCRYLERALGTAFLFLIDRNEVDYFAYPSPYKTSSFLRICMALN